ncbi:MAG: hypothetical protein PHS03_09235 [Sphaerochaeta sp.]|nr:hypothetical protein [Sphaerochaeta sp.]
MKKNHILTSITLTLLLSFMLLSCNADATAGLFRQISESKAPVGIVYKQIVGLDTTSPTRTLYYLTSEGLFSTDGTSSTKLLANEEGNIIQSAYLDTTTAAKVVFQTNDGTKKLYSYNLTTGALDSAAIADFSTYDTVKLLANGLVLAKDGVTNTFKFYNYSDSLNVIAGTPAVSGYALEAVLQLSGKEHLGASVSEPILISLTDGSNYKHFYYDGAATVTELNSSTSGYRFASMAFINSDVYLLTTDGKLYAAATPSAATFNLMHDTNESYEKHAFMYGYYDSGTTQTKLITKPSGVNDALYVLSISSTGVVSASDKTDGYGEYLNAAEIVGSYKKSANVLLVATLENGMYEIDITGDTSSETEAYTL